MTSIVLAFSLSALLGRATPSPAPVPTPTVEWPIGGTVVLTPGEGIEVPRDVPIATPPADLRARFCRKLVASIPEVCDAPPEDMGGCAGMRDQVCPRKGGRP